MSFIKSSPIITANMHEYDRLLDQREEIYDNE